MIDFLRIQNFKSLKNVSINLKALNLLIGLNSMGKSSVIQALLMLRQSFYKDGSLLRLAINGELTSLGNSRDILYQNANTDDMISFEINGDELDLFCSYRFIDNTDFLPAETVSPCNYSIPLFSERFCYLAADHISPSKTYRTSTINTINPVGNNGENAPYLLSIIGNNELKNSKLHHSKAKSNLIAHELDAWMGEISPGTRILSEEIVGLDIVRLSFEFETKFEVSKSKYINEFTSKYSPVNVGFGLPYALPLVLSVLTSEPGDLLIIENPESHLHPRGQAELGRLIALAAQSGVQIICETHSDHVINGIRVAVKERDIENERVGFLFFEKNLVTKLETEVTEIRIDKNGELDDYPDGLLDEWGNLMTRLF